MVLKILVLSDSHGELRYMQEAFCKEKPDAVVHLGDYLRDAERLRSYLGSVPLYAVPGNCDMRHDLLQSRIETFSGVRIFMTHGHAYHVKMTPLRAVLAAREAECGVLAFGHTHRALCEQQDGMWLLNPGSCNGLGVISYGIIVIENGTTACYNVRHSN